MNCRILIISILWSGVPMALASPPQALHDAIALEGVHVVAVDTGTALDARTVLIEHGMVSVFADGPHKDWGPSVRPPVTGYYLTPALHDAHVHIFDERDLQMYALFGVQTVRNMDGWPWHLALREEPDEPGVPRARLLTAGSQLQRPSITNADDALTRVSEEQAAGYDWVKLYDNLPGAALEGLTSRPELRVTGHLPTHVPLPVVLSSGVFDDIAHAEELAHALGRDYPDGDAGLDSLAGAMVESGVSLTTTIVNNQMIAEQVADFEANLAQPAVLDAPPLLQAFWNSPINPWKAPRDEDAARGFARQVEKLKGLVTGLHARGVRLIAGTDAPNPTTVPGASLHQELALLVDAGLTPAESLKTATTNAAALLGRKTHGAGIQAGMPANFIVTERNPLNDISSLNDFHALVIDGRWFSREAVVSMRQKLRDAYAKDLRILTHFKPDGPDEVFDAMDASEDEFPISSAGLTSLVWFYMKIGNPGAAGSVARRLESTYPTTESKAVAAYVASLPNH